MSFVPAPAAGDGPLEQDTPRGLLEAAARAQVAAIAAANPHWDGVICLPGDPTHWVHLSAGEIVSFQSFLTVRLAGAFGPLGTPDAAALEAAMARPERLAMLMRSGELGGNSDEILGALMGAELAAAKPYWLGQQVIVAGEDALAESYREALARLGAPVIR